MPKTDLKKELKQLYTTSAKKAALVDDGAAGLRDGPCVQILHIGPYSEEGPTIEKLRQFAAENGYTLTGKHHEIYFSDPRRVKPEKWRTILRLPVRRAG